VVNGVGYSSGSTGALRGGGFEFALIDSDNPSGHDSEGVIPALDADEPGEPVNSTHSVDPTTLQTAWGFGAVGTDPTNYGKQISLSCGSCHDPHGNGNYRILRTTPKGLFTHAQEENGEAAEVAIPDTSTKVYTTSNYWLADDVNAAGFAPNIAAWCSTCHTRYLSTGSASTPTGDAVFSYRHTSNKTSPGAGQRNCVQCHVAHGSNSTMGTKSQSVPFPGSLTGGGTDSRLLRVDSRGVCKLCHEDK
jgi:hypothetical protein